MEVSNSINFSNGSHLQSTNKKPLLNAVEYSCENVVQDANGYFVDGVWKSVDETLTSPHSSSLNSSNFPIKYQVGPERNWGLNIDFTMNDKSFCCYICGKKFAYNYQLNIHKKKEHDKKPIKCKYCGKGFNLNFALNRHIKKCYMYESSYISKKPTFIEHGQTHVNDTDGVLKTSYDCEICSLQFDCQDSITEHMKFHKYKDESVQIKCEDCKNYVPVDELNNHIQQCHYKCQKCELVFKNEQILNLHLSNCTNNFQKIWSKFRGVTRRNSSDQIDNDISISNTSIVQTVSHDDSIPEYVTWRNLIVNDCYVNAKEKKISNIENVTEENGLECFYLTDAANSDESTIKTTSHNLIMNNYDLNMKNEKLIHNNSKENNSSDLTDVSYQNNLILTIPPYTNTITNISVKEKLEDNNVVRETEYFCIRKLPKVNETSNSSVEYICKICRNARSVNLHSFATHMIRHSQCSLHECTVCDEQFFTVIQWTHHMMNHEQQLNLTNSEINHNKVEPITNISINSERMRPQVLSISSGGKENNSSIIKIKSKYLQSSNITTVNNSYKKNEMKFICEICKRIFSTMQFLICHQKLHSKSTNNSVNAITDNVSKSKCCKICYLQFASSISLANHMRIHSTPKCKSTQFGEKGHYSNHIKSHNNCNKKNENLNSTNSRIAKVIPNLTKKNRLWFPCDACEKKYSTPFQLIIHRRSHCAIGPYLCKLCNKMFNVRYKWNKHLKYHYMKNKLKRISNKEQRGKSSNLNNGIDDNINSKKSFNKILSRELNTKPSISTVRNLNNSVNAITDNVSKSKCCKICYIQFASSKSLANHMRIHSTPLTKKNRLWFPCDACEKKYSTPFQLIMHRRSHCDIEPYLCKLCNKMFNVRYKWNKHLKCHYKKK